MSADFAALCSQSTRISCLLVVCSVRPTRQQLLHAAGHRYGRGNNISRDPFICALGNLLNRSGAGRKVLCFNFPRVIRRVRHIQVTPKKTKEIWPNFRATLCIAQTMPWQDVCPSVCPSVRLSRFEPGVKE